MFAPSPANKISLAERMVADLGVIAVIALWWLWSKHLPDYVLPGPEAVLRRMAALVVDPAFLKNALLSTSRVVWAIAIAMVLGTVLALVPFYLPPARYVVQRMILPFFNSFPSLGWVLLATIWFSVSEFTVLFVQSAILLPFCLINVSEGVRALDPDTLEMGKSFTRRQSRVFFRIMLPLLMPYLIGALRISYGVAWKIALLAELFGARNGVGYVMLQAQVAADSVLMLSTCLFIVVFFILGDRLIIRPLAERFGEVRT